MMKARSVLSTRTILLATSVLMWSPLAPAMAETDGIAPTESITLSPLTGDLAGDGTMGSAARQSMLDGPLPASQADVDAKAAANAAYQAALSAGSVGPTAAPSEADGMGAQAEGTGSAAPTVLLGRNGQHARQTSAFGTPPDTTGAVGPTRFIQLVNSRFAIYRKNGNLVNAGTLDTLFGISANNFDPQIIWDSTTNRFYYSGDSVVSSSDNRIAFGFSKTRTPNNGGSDWCHYTITNYGSLFPDYPKMGDNQHFVWIGVNVYDTNDFFQRADLLAMDKPSGTGPITSCPTATGTIFQDLRDDTNAKVFTATPANQIDTGKTGVAWARNLNLPSSRMWIFRLGRNGAGDPTVSNALRLTLPQDYVVPPNATQPDIAQKLDTSDTRGTQAILAKNPRRGGKWSLWTQQTVASGSTSTVRWYEIRAIGGLSLLAQGTPGTSNCFKFNGAVSSDRRVLNGKPSKYGKNMVLAYSVSGKTGCNLYPRIVAGSKIGGQAMTFQLVKNGTNPYRDHSCPGGTDFDCRWGDYSGATPNPTGTGDVWITNQYSKVANPDTAAGNWWTWIADIKP